MLHGRSPPLLGLVVGGLGLVDALVENLGVLVLYDCQKEHWHAGEKVLTAASLEASARRRLSAMR